MAPELHSEVTQLVMRIEAPSAALPAARRVPPQLALPTVGVPHGGRLHMFPRLPSSALRSVIKVAVAPSRRKHLIEDLLGDSDSRVVREWLDFDRDNRGLLMPVMHDLQFRLAFRMLPVGARFSFLQSSRPDITCCPLDGCRAAETERHLFFECTRALELWATVGRDWVPLLGRLPTWNHIVHPSSVPISSSHDLDPDAVRSVWYIFRAIVLHQLWTQRNEFVFDKRRPLTLSQHVLKIYSTFAAHLRYLRRREALDSAALERIIDTLRTSGSGGIVFERFPRLLATRDVTRLVPLATIRSIFGHTGRS